MKILMSNKEQVKLQEEQEAIQINQVTSYKMNYKKILIQM